MRRLIAFVILLNAVWIGNAETIHVYSTEIPWSSEVVEMEVDKIYSINEAIAHANVGDEILIHEGIYREKIVVNKNNLTLRNFETDYVLVSGCELVKNWADASSMSSGVKVADISNLTIETSYSQLFVNGKQQLMARHPNNTTGDMMDPMGANSGYALLSNVHKDAGTNANGHATLGGTSLPNVDLTGGIFRGMTGKMRNYVYGTVTSSSGNSVSFKAINNGVWKNEAAIKNTQHKFSWGYVLHKNLIDVPGEWFIDADKLYFMPLNSQNLSESRIEIQVREKVLVLNNTSGVTLGGIQFVAGNVDMQNTSGATIENCTMRYLHPFWTPTGYGQGSTDKTGVYLSNSSDNLFKNVYVGQSWGNVFALKDGENNTFENCIIEDFGWVGVFTSAIHINKSNNTNIKQCTFGHAGRFQVRIDGGDAMVNITDCDFYGSMKMGEDAGPIEATSTGKIGALDLKGSVIAYNKIHDVHGVPVSDGNYNKVKATAFYMEDTQGYTAHHNLIYNIKGDKYTGPHEIQRVGEFLYLGPRYNAMHEEVNYYNNTIWNVDYNISIWNIEIDNWQELEIAPPDTTGLMENGHFANNIFMNGPKFKMNYVRQKLSSTGGNQGYISLDPESDIETADFEAYTKHCSNWGYNFNPQNNVSFDEDDASNNFNDALIGDFTLLEASSAKNAGIELDGITSSETPDCGALEGGDRVLYAGATLEIPQFKEMDNVLTSLNQHNENDKLKLFPNPSKRFVKIGGFNPADEELLIDMFSLNGTKLYSKIAYPAGEVLQLDISNIPSGMYILSLKDYPDQKLKLIKK